MDDPSDTSPLDRDSTEPSHAAAPRTPADAAAAAHAPAAAAPVAAPVRTARRRWWLAGLLALFGAPGGQIYNGQPRKGIVVMLSLYLLLGLASVITLVHLPLWVPALLFALAFALGIYLPIDAIVEAIRAGPAYRLRRYNRWFVYLFLVAAAYIAPRLWVRAVNQVVKTFYIPSGSMAPTLLIGDHLFVDCWSYRFAAPRRGEVVVYRFPENPALLSVKRVVAVGGDRIEIRDRQLLLNGRAVAEPYAVHSDRQADRVSLEATLLRDNLAAQTVPAGAVFVLGDNRDNSFDSRFFGPIQQDSITCGGRLRLYWSWDAARHATRWERTGRFVQ